MHLFVYYFSEEGQHTGLFSPSMIGNVFLCIALLCAQESYHQIDGSQLNSWQCEFVSLQWLDWKKLTVLLTRELILQESIVLSTPIGTT